MRSLRVPVLLAPVLALAGCGISSTGPISFGAAPNVGAQAEVVYFVGADGYSLRPALRQRPGARVVPGKVPDQGISDLSAGPTAAELAAGFSSRVPLNLDGYVTIRDAADGGPSVTVILVARNPEATASVTALAAEQVACTVLANDVPPDDAHLVVTVEDTVYREPTTTRCPVPLTPPPG